jgi:hypothetical protein
MLCWTGKILTERGSVSLHHVYTRPSSKFKTHLNVFKRKGMLFMAQAGQYVRCYEATRDRTLNDK